MSLVETLRSLLTNPFLLGIWAIVVTGSLAVLVRDLWTKNEPISGLMKAVWVFTVLYSGPLGLAIYWYTGRTQISYDSLWRKGFRSVCHCYSGCGAGEVTGIFIALGILALGNLYVALATFALAYVFGYAMTVGPLMQEGVPLKEALIDAFYTETASITVMEIVAIGTDLWLVGEATMSDVLFWAALVFSLSMGLLAAYPVNVLLIYFGVKEGMMNPAQMA